MKDPLAVYLHDHLAGAAYALDLVESLERNNQGTVLGSFASQLHTEISADKDELHEIARRLGPASDLMKDLAAWFAEKISRIKLNHSEPKEFGVFEALELLVLGIHGKFALWQILSQVATQRTDLDGINFDRLITRATEQEKAVEQYRIALGRAAFVSQKQLELLNREKLSHLGPAIASHEVRRTGATDEKGYDLENPT